MKKETIILHRHYGAQGTNGDIRYQGEHICHSIELPNRGNETNKSCIPEGRYKLVPYHSKKFPNEIGVADVPRRSAILFHAANYAATELRGCIAPVTKLTGDGRGDSSALALSRFKALVHSLWDMGMEVNLVIRGSGS